MRDFWTAKTNSTGLNAAQIQFGFWLIFDLVVSCVSARSGCTLDLKFEQPALADREIRQTQERLHLCSVLIDTLKHTFLKPKVLLKL